VTNFLEQVEEFLEGSTGDSLGYRFRSPWEELIEGTLYRCTAINKTNKAVVVRVYGGLREFGGRLWEQEVGVLQRVASIGHPAIPRILGGGYRQQGDFGYIVTPAPEEDPDGTRLMERLRMYREDPLCLLQPYGQLLDGLATLHASGLMHRAVTPQAILFREADNRPSGFELQLGRFEMSSLVSGMLRPNEGAGAEVLQEIRPSLVSSRGRARAYVPPERYVELYGGGLETERSDVYSLGVLGFECFIDDLPVDLLDGPIDDPQEWLEKLRRGMRVCMHRSPLPRRFIEVIEAMIDPEPQFRLAAGEAAARFAEEQEILRRHLGIYKAGDGRPHVLAYMAREADVTVRKRWGWVANDTSTEEGEAELVAFLSCDLECAELVHSPGGANDRKGIVTSSSKKDRLATAQYVLMGREAAWFCSSYSGEGVAPFDVLVIRYVLPRGHQSIRDIEEAELRCPVPEVEFTPFASIQHVVKATGLPASWEPIIRTVQSESPARRNKLMCDAFEWLIDYQKAELDLRSYAYKVPDDGTAVGGDGLLEHDASRDQKRLIGPGLLQFCANKGRSSFGDYFDELAESAVEGEVEVGDARKLALSGKEQVPPSMCWRRREGDAPPTLANFQR